MHCDVRFPNSNGDLRLKSDSPYSRSIYGSCASLPAIQLFNDLFQPLETVHDTDADCNCLILALLGYSALAGGQITTVRAVYRIASLFSQR